MVNIRPHGPPCAITIHNNIIQLALPTSITQGIGILRTGAVLTLIHVAVLQEVKMKKKILTIMTILTILTILMIQTIIQVAQQMLIAMSTLLAVATLALTTMVLQLTPSIRRTLTFTMTTEETTAFNN